MQRVKDCKERREKEIKEIFMVKLNHVLDWTRHLPDCSPTHCVFDLLKTTLKAKRKAGSEDDYSTGLAEPQQEIY